MGQRIRVLVVRIDPVEKKVEFAVLDPSPVKPSHRQSAKPKSRKTRKAERRNKKDKKFR
jgi:hypothetical protein